MGSNVKKKLKVWIIDQISRKMCKNWLKIVQKFDKNGVKMQKLIKNYVKMLKTNENWKKFKNICSKIIDDWVENWQKLLKNSKYWSKVKKWIKMCLKFQKNHQKLSNNVKNLSKMIERYLSKEVFKWEKLVKNYEKMLKIIENWIKIW